jgi:hypothetical protein
MTEERTHSRDSVRFEVVYTANGEAEAHGVRSALEAAGIPTEMELASATKLFPVTVDGLGAVRLRVPSDMVDEARAIIETPAETATDDQ